MERRRLLLRLSERNYRCHNSNTMPGLRCTDAWVQLQILPALWVQLTEMCLLWYCVFQESGNTPRLALEKRCFAVSHVQPQSVGRLATGRLVGAFSNTLRGTILVQSHNKSKFPLVVHYMCASMCSSMAFVVSNLLEPGLNFFRNTCRYTLTQTPRENSEKNTTDARAANTDGISAP